MKNWKLYLTTGVTFLSLGITHSALAQGGYGNVYDAPEAALVTVYEHCEYRGASRSIDVGEYRNMRSIQFGNDQMSSIKVPKGIEVTIYEDDDFHGDYARINRDLSCFDQSWNDKVSSMRISSGRYGDRYRDRSNDAGRSNGRRNNGNDRSGSRDDSNVTGKNVSQVVFGSTVLQQINKKQWQLNDPRRGVSQFRETRRDDNTVYLQNDYTAERVRIDLFANDVTFTGREGRAQRYTIKRKQAALSTPRSRPAVSRDSQNRRIRSDCFNFRAYTRGGNGGLRFHGKGEFYRFGKKAETGRVCHNGSLTMEISKTDPNTNVVVEIDDNRYRFDRKEKEDALKNTWYRKFVRLKVGR